jgi:hypothetical protein
MPFPTSDAESRIAHQPKNGRKPRASAMQNIDASGIPVRPASCGPACKTEGLLSTNSGHSASAQLRTLRVVLASGDDDHFLAARLQALCSTPALHPL